MLVLRHFQLSQNKTSLVSLETHSSEVFKLPASSFSKKMFDISERYIFASHRERTKHRPVHD